MKTTVDKEILKENWWLIVGPVLFILLGILLIVLPNRPVDYASLQTKEVTVEALKYHYGRHGSDYHDIRTTDGERYVIKGDYRWEQLEDLLTKDTIITVKWYESDLGGLCAEEVYVDGERVVVYNGDLPLKNNIRLMLSVFAIVLGLGTLCFVKRTLVTLTEQKRKTVKLLRKNKKRKK